MAASGCPCESGQEYKACCGPYLEGMAAAPTAEALMRSRYTAFVRNRIDYIDRTCVGDMRDTSDRVVEERDAPAVEWIGLEILDRSFGGEADETGTVEFAARYMANGAIGVHRENSVFRREAGQWVYVAGDVVPAGGQTAAAKIGRNDPCPCGSGKKFKKCCGR